ncbi:unnamed protein product, partial [marine sediment metagenome]
MPELNSAQTAEKWSADAQRALDKMRKRDAESFRLEQERAKYAADCPFCGAQGDQLGTTIQFSQTPDGSGVERYAFHCFACGASSGPGDTPAEAFQ